MLKRWFWRWRYRRLPDSSYDIRVRNLTLLTRYCRFARRLSFDRSDYRTRIQYQLATKTEHIGELVDLTNRIQNLLAVDSPHVDHLHLQYRVRSTHRLDMYLIDADHVPLEETDAVERLIASVSQVVAELERLNNKKPSLYVYYNQSLQYYIADVVDVLDAFISMQLGVSNGRRHAPSLIVGR